MFLSNITANRERRVNKLSLPNSGMFDHSMQSNFVLTGSFLKRKNIFHAQGGRAV